MMNSNDVVAVVGLGYVGMPLAVEFGKKRTTIGFDLSASKIESYRNFIDPTGELSSAELRAASPARSASPTAAAPISRNAARRWPA